MDVLTVREVTKFAADYARSGKVVHYESSALITRELTVNLVQPGNLPALNNGLFFPLLG